MAQIATYSEISDYLRTLPAASLSWAEGLYAANLSMGAVVALVETMMDDVESPLRAAQEGVMSQEIVKLNLTRGCGAVGKDVASKMGVRVRNVLSATERTRVVRSVNSFAQPIFEARGSFGRNGHAVMNAVRRICAAYMGAKIPKNATIIEVGPDVRHSLMSPTSSRWIEEGIDYYTGARPNLVPRDILRTDWQRMVAIVRKYGVREFSSATVAAAELMADNYSELFPDATIQELKKPGEYITSYDSNYDVAFSDMPKSMALCGARAWHGCMVRAKGLTSRSRVDSGKLDLLGVNYRVDWKNGKISFRHPECSAFGYTHNVWEYMKYEENNGFVWTGQNFHFVYSKSPETTSELLFFSVVRIPSALRIMEPRYVEHVYAGMMRLTSVWAVGDEINGIPNSFQQIVFHVDALNFSKVLEKRRALDHKGDLSVTVNLVRATNVRFWLNGTPVGASERIESRLAEAAAVLIETVVAERRRETNLLFDKAMYEFDLNVKRSGFLVRLLSSIFDVRAAAGCVSGPITRMWSSMRGALIDAALAPISKLSVGYERVEEHILLGLSQTEHLNEQIQLGTNSSCKCLEIADCYAAILMAGEAEQADLLGYIGSLRVLGKTCKCEKSVAEIEYLASEEKKTDSGYGSGNATDTSDCLEDDESVSDEGDVTCIDISDCWRDDANINTPEWRSMDEFLRLETYLQTNLMIEIRSDVVAIEQQGRITQMTLEALTTPRTSHNYVRIMGHKVVERMGPDFGDYSAVYDKLKDRLVKVNRRGSAISVPVVDGWYYTCSRLAVWNFEEILAATNYALDYGVVDAFRKKYEVTMGVPGAGKTYSMMERLWKEYSDEPFTFFVLSATKAAALSATNVGVKFGFKRELLERCVMTADKYLMHKKMGAEVLCVDEVSAMHMGKVDVLSAIVGAKSIRLYGDAKQVPYDPFTAEFVMEWNVLGDTVPLSNVSFMSQTHRFGERMCAIWVDCYPAIYPCTCCQTEEKENMQISMIRHRDLSHLSYDPNVRYHTYRQNEKEELRTRFGLRESPEVLRAKSKGGMATVHEDQGSTHSDVVTVRIHSEYDKNASSRNPSLYNRVNYVLSDMTRAVDNYLYYTMCEEDDEICKRIKLAKDEERLKCVREKRAFGSVSLRDMLF